MFSEILGTMLYPVVLVLISFFFFPGRKSNTDMETIKNQPREKTKRKRGRGKNVGIDKVVQMSTEGSKGF